MDQQSALDPSRLHYHLSPEGVPLVKAWYARRIEGELAEIESALETPVAHLGSRASPEAVAAQKGRWKGRAKQLMDDVEFHGAPRTVAERLAEVDAVTADSIYEYFQALPIDTGGHLTSVGPRNWPSTD